MKRLWWFLSSLELHEREHDGAEVSFPATLGSRIHRLVLARTDLEGARVVAERCRARVEAIELSPERAAFELSATFGVTSVADRSDGRGERDPGRESYRAQALAGEVSGALIVRASRPARRFDLEDDGTWTERPRD